MFFFFNYYFMNAPFTFQHCDWPENVDCKNLHATEPMKSPSSAVQDNFITESSVHTQQPTKEVDATVSSSTRDFGGKSQSEVCLRNVLELFLLRLIATQ